MTDYDGLPPSDPIHETYGTAMTLLERDEGALYYDLTDIAPPWAGPRETILFLHGLAIDSDIWAPWLPALVDQYRVVRLDMRGFGRSFVPKDRAGWSMAAIAADVRAVMAAVGAEKVHFIGESTGGTVGLHMAAHQPEALHALTMVSAAHRGGAIGRVTALRGEIASLGMDQWSEKLMAQRFHDGAITPAMWRWFHDVQRKAEPRACVDLLDMLVQVDLTARLKEITTPTLIIAPDDSPFVSVESAVERLRAMPNARLQVIAGARHGVAFSHGAECAKALKAFLGRAGKTRGGTMSAAESLSVESKAKMVDDNRTTAIGLARYAVEFLDAALAADDVVGKRRGYEINAPAPVMFLVAHSMELCLKAYLRSKGFSLDELRALSHHLSKCWDEAVKQGLEQHVRLSPQDEEVFGLIGDLHASTELRYIKTGFKQVPVFGPLEVLARKLLETVCPLVGYQR